MSPARHLAQVLRGRAPSAGVVGIALPRSPSPGLLLLVRQLEGPTMPCQPWSVDARSLQQASKPEKHDLTLSSSMSAMTDPTKGIVWKLLLQRQRHKQRGQHRQYQHSDLRIGCTLASPPRVPASQPPSPSPLPLPPLPSLPPPFVDLP